MVARHLLAGALLLAVGGPVAAQPKGTNEAIKKGAEFLTQRHRDGLPGEKYGIGPPALAGLALLESGSNADDAAIKTITAAVREAAYTETKTYQITLCLLYLDKLSDRADLPLIQVLAVRLLAGQNPTGGWGYNCLDSVPAGDERRLRTGLTLDTNQLATGKAVPKAEPGRAGVTGRLHPEVEGYAKGLLENRGRGDIWDDNSNTQFGILGVWVARRNGVPVEAALDRIEQRFIRSQHRGTGGWPYSGLVGGPGSASMTCCGLLGLATGVARREENRLTAVAMRKPDPKPAAPPPPPPVQGGDPFFNPPPRPKVEPPPPKAPPPVQGDPANPAVRAALMNLGEVLAAEARKRAQGGRAFDRAGGHGDGDLYFMWSLERVAMVYGLDRIGNVDWYALGAESILAWQNADGSWGRGRYGQDVDTAFALLFLTRANVARDLTSIVKNAPGTAEMRGGRGIAGIDANPDPPAAVGSTEFKVPAPAAVVPPRPPVPVLGESAADGLANGLIRAPAAGWAGELERVRDAKGGDNTTALVLAIAKLGGDRKKQARDALAERLTRMTATTLRTMLTGDDAELRRAAVLACAMKDDKEHVPDLIDRLTDADDAVVRAARASVKSLTASKIDFGPEPGSTPAQRKTAAAAWRSWWATQKP